MIKIFKTPIHSTPAHVFICILLLFGCSPNKEKQENAPDEAVSFTSYTEDVSFLEKYTEIIQLSHPDGGVVAVSPALQGRVMTSSPSAAGGRSYGWINRGLFESGDTLEHINAFGGEERFWMGPEGGQFSIFFKKGDTFTLDSWQTPRLIDLDAFKVVSVRDEYAVFSKEASLTNYTGFTFDVGIERRISVLSKEKIADKLGLPALENINAVGYETTNTLTNKGSVKWEKETGLLSIWILGMFTPSDNTTIVIPFQPGVASSPEQFVNDTYFGKVPSDRLKIGEKVIFFQGDGKYRSKIGIRPEIAMDLAGAYDAGTNTLTIIKYNKPEGVIEYVNSIWEIQDKPYAGDVVNSYNDGPPSPGSKPLGPFYELETSSPALALSPGESKVHIQLTCHLEGNEKDLDPIAKQLLGISLNEISNAFK